MLKLSNCRKTRLQASCIRLQLLNIFLQLLSYEPWCEYRILFLWSLIIYLLGFFDKKGHSNRECCCVEGWCAKTGDFVPSVPEGLYFPILHWGWRQLTATQLTQHQPLSQEDPLTDFASPEAFSQIHNWIDECTNNHGTKCRKRSSNFSLGDHWYRNY
jgi:hypothetical protein